MEVFVHSFAHALGSHAQTVEAAVARDQTRSAAAQLRRAGFDRHRVCTDDETAYELARRAVDAIGDELGTVDVILYATCLPLNAALGGGPAIADGRDVKHLMDFPAGRLQTDLQLTTASVIGIDQQACTGMLGSLRIGAALLRSEPDTRRILCVTADRFPAGARYEQAYNLVSDGAAACVLSRERRGFRLLGCHALTNGALARGSEDETVAVYFTYTHRLIRDITAKAGLSVGDIDWIVPQNMNRTAWSILARLLGIDRSRVRCDSLAEVGHVISADNLINLDHLDRSGAIRAGQRVLLVMAGYGLHWQAVLLEKC